MRLATAESCTGGGIAASLTDLAGSSEWFECGYITYSNASKTRMLGVPEETLAEFGAVSPEAALAMACGALERSGADAAISVTGIAGPGGGTADKPVGLVYTGYALRDSAPRIIRHNFSGSRADIRAHTGQSVLKNLIDLLEKQ